LAAYRANRIASSYLFIGKEGSGTVEVAKEFAKLLNCKSPVENPCDNCQSCHQIDKGIHPDVHWYFGTGRVIPISAVRDIEKYINLKPYEAKKKIFIITEAQYLNEESSNALLKTLEEPPVDSLLILITTDSKNLLPTITSRCQRIIFNSLDDKEIKGILMKDYRLPLFQANFISYLAEGSLGKALEFNNRKEEILEKRDCIINSILFKKFSLFKMEEFSSHQANQKRNNLFLLLDLLLSWLMDLLRIKIGLTEKIINLDKLDSLEKISKNYSFEELLKNINIVANTKYFISKNTNVKLSFGRLRAELWNE